MQLQRILVIADRNRARDVALDRAVALARRSGARIHLVGFCYDPLIESEDLPIAFNRDKARRQLLADVQSNLDWLIDRNGADDVKITTETVWIKQLHEWVMERKGEYDLAVKTGHRSENLFYTPTDWHLLRTSPIPLLIVSTRRWKRRSHHVLATVDLASKKKVQKELNQQVLEHAATLAKVLESELHIVYALPISRVLKELDVIEPQIEERKFRSQQRENLQQLAADYGIPLKHIHIKAGDAEKVIPGIARKIKAEVVVMGTVARRGVKAALVGNTAEQVLSAVPTDVVAMRPQ